MKGTLETSFTKGTETVTRKLTPDTKIILASGKTGQYPEDDHSLLVRNVGMHISTEIVTVQGKPIPETLIDAVVTTMCGMHDLLNNEETTNSPNGSIYIVKPKISWPTRSSYV